MKKRTKLFLIFFSLFLVLAAIITLILVFSLRNPYLEKLPYDDVDDTIYNGIEIVSENGLLYLSQDGETFSKGYSYLKSVNDFYERTDPASLAERRLLNYYLAKDAEGESYLLLDNLGNESRIAGENFSLSEIALPYLIFTNNSDSRMTALSLLALQSDLTARSKGEITFVQTFDSVSAQRYDDEHELYDCLIVKNDASETPKSIYSSNGSLLLSGTNPLPIFFEKDHEKSVCYFVDEETNSLYSSSGILLSVSSESVYFSEEEGWGCQPIYDEDSDRLSGENPSAIFVFSANHYFSLFETEYDFSGLQIFQNMLILPKLHSDDLAVICPKSKKILLYDSVKIENGLLRASLAENSDWIYLDEDGEELLRTPYEDMVRHSLSRECCTVLVSERCNAEQTDQHSYFLVVGGNMRRLDLPAQSTLSIPESLCEDADDFPVYLISEEDTDGTPLSRIYVPFAITEQSKAYHIIDFTCHGGIVWALGTSYTDELYDILDPINNCVVFSLSAKKEDMARLSFEYCTTDAMPSDPYTPDSTVPLLLLKLNRYDEIRDTVSATRYFALYRTAPSSAKTFQSTTLRIKELGQNLLLSTPFEFFSEQNCLVIRSISGSEIFRFNASCELVEYASTPYFVTDVLTDASDATLCYFKVSPLTDRISDLTRSEKFGLVDSQGKLILGMAYEDILSAENNRFSVNLRQATGVVEWDGEELSVLIDFRHSALVSLADGGYLGVDLDGTHVVYNAKGKAIQKGTVCSVSFLTTVQTDEDGFLTYNKALLLNVDGVLYRHMPQTFQAPVCTEVLYAPSHSGALTDRRGKLIAYYDEDETLIEQKLWVPTVSVQQSFSEAHEDPQVLFSLDPEEPIPVTAEEIATSSEHFFKLYCIFRSPIG